MEHVKSPEGIKKLIEELWLRHKAAVQQPKPNIYLVDLPLPTDEELAECNSELNDQKEIDSDPEDIYASEF